MAKTINSLGLRSNRSISRYFSEIGKFSPLPPEREVELAIRIQNGEDLAMKELVESNLRFVVSVAKKYQGNGISLIIFAGIVARMPAAMANTAQLVTTGEMGVFGIIILAVLVVAVIAFIVYMEQAQRRIPVHYAKRVVGRKMYGGQSSHLPLKINTAGVIPPIFASSIIMFPTTLAQFVDMPLMQDFSAWMSPGTILYYIVYVGFVVFFCYLCVGAEEALNFSV